MPRPLGALRAALATALLLTLLAGCRSAPRSQSGHIRPGTSVRHTLQLDAGDSAVVRVYQLSAMLKVSVTGPSGTPVAQADSTGVGWEILAFTAAKGGTHTVVLEAADESPELGEYIWQVDLNFSREAAQQVEEASKLHTIARTQAARRPPDNAGARQALEKAAALFAAARETTGELTALLSLAENLGQNAGQDRESALRSATQKLGEIARRADAIGDFALAADALLGRSSLLLTLGEFAEANQAQEQALDRSRRSNFLYGEAAALLNRGLVERFQHNYRTAVTYYERMNEIATRIGSRSLSGVALNNQGVLLLMMGDPAAVRYFERAEALLTNSRRAQVRLLLAYRYLGAGDVARARGKHEEAKADFGGAPGAISQCALLLGEIEERSGNLAAARKSYEEALRLSESPRTTADAHAFLGGISLAERQFAAARSHFQQALRGRHALRDTAGTISVSRGIAQAELASGAPDRAAAQIDEAERMVQQLVSSTPEGADRAKFIASRYEVFETAVDIHIARGKTSGPLNGARALERFEAGLVRNLLDRVSSDPGNRPEVPEIYRKRLVAAERRVVASMSNPLQAAEAKAAKDNVTREIAARFGPARPAWTSKNLHQIQEYLKQQPGTALLAIAPGPAASHLWVVTGGAVETTTGLPPRATLDQWAKNTTDAFLAERPDRAVLEKLGSEISRQLFEKLTPAQTRILSSARRLAIVTTGPLLRIAFEALPVPASLNPTPGQHLIGLRYQVVRWPSASVAVTLAMRPPRLPARDIAVSMTPSTAGTIAGAASPSQASRAFPNPMRSRASSSQPTKAPSSPACSPAPSASAASMPAVNSRSSPTSPPSGTSTFPATLSSTTTCQTCLESNSPRPAAPSSASAERSSIRIFSA